MTSAKTSADHADDSQLTKLLHDLRHFRAETEKTQLDLLQG